MLGLEARPMSFELGILPSLDTLSYYHAFKPKYIGYETFPDPHSLGLNI